VAYISDKMGNLEAKRQLGWEDNINLILKKHGVRALTGFIWHR
jgi:hypothetical protein